jgi:hypothetical protein
VAASLTNGFLTPEENLSKLAESEDKPYLRQMGVGKIIVRTLNPKPSMVDTLEQEKSSEGKYCNTFGYKNPVIANSLARG